MVNECPICGENNPDSLHLRRHPPTELCNRNRLVDLLKAHKYYSSKSGDGYTEPRQYSDGCTCGAIYDSFIEGLNYIEPIDDPEDAHAKHLAYLIQSTKWWKNEPMAEQKVCHPSHCRCMYPERCPKHHYIDCGTGPYAKREEEKPPF